MPRRNRNVGCRNRRRPPDTNRTQQVVYAPSRESKPHRYETPKVQENHAHARPEMYGDDTFLLHYE